MEYTIGITTYSYRFEKYLTDLIKKIRQDRLNEIILAINGNYRETFNEKYRRDVLGLSARYDKIFPFIYPNFRSLAKMWNNIMINSSNEYVLLLNDDTTIIDPLVFFNTIEEYIDKYQTSFKTEKLFCCFVVKRSELNELGWFDERFLGIGGEDNNFEERYEEHFGHKILNFNGIPGVKSYLDHENAIVNQRKNGKYSQFNQEIYDLKLKSVEQYPHEKFYWENYNNL